MANGMFDFMSPAEGFGADFAQQSALPNTSANTGGGFNFMTDTKFGANVPMALSMIAQALLPKDDPLGRAAGAAGDISNRMAFQNAAAKKSAQQTAGQDDLFKAVQALVSAKGDPSGMDSIAIDDTGINFKMPNIGKAEQLATSFQEGRPQESLETPGTGSASIFPF